MIADEKGLTNLCCEHVKYNPYNKVVQCHKCGKVVDYPDVDELWRDRDRLGEAVILLKLTRDLHKVWKDILPNTGKIDEFLAAMKND